MRFPVPLLVIYILRSFLLHLKSPAKINLFLKILHKRRDGYHELASLFQAVSLFDEIIFKSHDRDEFTCSHNEIPLNEENLIIKALELFRKKTKISFPLKIHLEKNIPHQAGLGGGSSNAATTLWALNALANFQLTEEELINLGSEIGSDVPFFLSHGSAFCTGRGEKIKEVNPIKSEEFYLIKPDIKLSTKEVYSYLSIDNFSQRNPEMDLKDILEGKSIYYNDLEDAAFSYEPKLREFKQYLIKIGFKTVLLSGSGSAFFCIGNGDLNQLDKDIWKSKVNFIYRNKNKWFN